MKVLDALRKEHQLFRSLLGKLERASLLEENEARSEFRNILLVLFPALEEHERIEHSLFDPLLKKPHEAQKRFQQFLRKVDQQHEQLASLRKDVRLALEDSYRQPFNFARNLVLQMVQHMNEHLDSEEQLLWPEYMNFLGQPAMRTAGQSIQKQVEFLAQDIRKREDAVEQYLGMRRP